MPKLQDDRSTLDVNGVSHFPPAGKLCICVATRRVRVALRLGRHLSGLGDDQAGACTLTIVFSGEGARGETRPCTVAGEWRHDDPIAEFEVAEIDAFKQRLRGAGLVGSDHGCFLRAKAGERLPVTPRWAAL